MNRIKAPGFSINTDEPHLIKKLKGFNEENKMPSNSENISYGYVYKISHPNTIWVYIGSLAWKEDYTVDIRYKQHLKNFQNGEDNAPNYLFRFEDYPSIEILERQDNITFQDLRVLEQEWMDAFRYKLNRIRAVYSYEEQKVRRNTKRRDDLYHSNKKRIEDNVLHPCPYCGNLIQRKRLGYHKKYKCPNVSNWVYKTCDGCNASVQGDRMKDHRRRCPVYCETSEHCNIYYDGDTPMKQCTLCDTTFIAKNGKIANFMKHHDKVCPEQT